MEIKVAQVVKFKGYTEEVPDPILKAGQLVKVRAINPDGGLIVDQIDDNGVVVENVDRTETLWPEEVDLVDEADVPETAKTEAPAAEAAPAKGGKKGGKKIGASTPAQEAPAQAAPAAEAAPAPAKAKGKGKGKAAEVPAAAAPAASVPAAPATEALEGTVLRSELVRAALSSVAADANDEMAAVLAAKSLINQVDETYYTLGGVLAYIKETGVYKRLGYDGKRGFADYCKTELGTDYRKAQYLIDVFEKVQAAGLNEKRLAEIGWSKAIQIMRVGDVSLDKLSEDFDNLVEFAKAHTRDELISHIKTSYEGVSTRTGRQSEETVNVSTFVFKLTSEEAVSAERALNHAKTLSGSEELNDAFKYIMDDWALMTEGTTMDLATAVQVLEARFGVTLTVEGGEAEENAIPADEEREEVPA